MGVGVVLACWFILVALATFLSLGFAIAPFIFLRSGGCPICRIVYPSGFRWIRLVGCVGLVGWVSDWVGLTEPCPLR